MGVIDCVGVNVGVGVGATYSAVTSKIQSGVRVGVIDCVGVNVSVGVMVWVGVSVIVGVIDCVGVSVGVIVNVGVGVGVGITYVMFDKHKSLYKITLLAESGTNTLTPGLVVKSVNVIPVALSPVLTFVA